MGKYQKKLEHSFKPEKNNSYKTKRQTDSAKILQRFEPKKNTLQEKVVLFPLQISSGPSQPFFVPNQQTCYVPADGVGCTGIFYIVYFNSYLFRVLPRIIYW